MENIHEIFFLVFAILLALAIIAIPTMIIFLGYKWLAAKGYQSVGFVLAAVVSGWIAYSIYTAIFPTDAYYFNAFEEVTLRVAPPSSKILDKTASFPDFHGEYCSAALVELSPSDYSNLFLSLSADYRLSKGKTMTGSEESSQLMGERPSTAIRYGFTRDIPAHPDLYLFVGFLEDGKTIIVDRCAT